MDNMRTLGRPLQVASRSSERICRAQPLSNMYTITTELLDLFPDFSLA
jgi:hypothetical protein